MPKTRALALLLLCFAAFLFSCVSPHLNKDPDCIYVGKAKAPDRKIIVVDERQEGKIHYKRRDFIDCLMIRR